MVGQASFDLFDRALAGTRESTDNRSIKNVIESSCIRTEFLRFPGDRFSALQGQSEISIIESFIRYPYKQVSISIDSRLFLYESFHYPLSLSMLSIYAMNAD
uniref:Uncharacterized protein n=1 Tax=Picea sitchensis TaxID=3332 RepID=A0A6B9XUI8_PICSI|nr:hypothetical protein Q903MT_gene3784 [Picea sitchensis]